VRNTFVLIALLGFILIFVPDLFPGESLVEVAMLIIGGIVALSTGNGGGNVSSTQRHTPLRGEVVDVQVRTTGGEGSNAQPRRLPVQRSTVPRTAKSIRDTFRRY
jgi:hypothetical protein